MEGMLKFRETRFERRPIPGCVAVVLRKVQLVSLDPQIDTVKKVDIDKKLTGLNAP